MRRVAERMRNQTLANAAGIVPKRKRRLIPQHVEVESKEQDSLQEKRTKLWSGIQKQIDSLKSLGDKNNSGKEVKQGNEKDSSRPKVTTPSMKSDKTANSTLIVPSKRRDESISSTTMLPSIIKNVDPASSKEMKSADSLHVKVMSPSVKSDVNMVKIDAIPLKSGNISVSINNTSPLVKSDNSTMGSLKMTKTMTSKVKLPSRKSDESSRSKSTLPPIKSDATSVPKSTTIQSLQSDEPTRSKSTSPSGKSDASDLKVTKSQNEMLSASLDSISTISRAVLAAGRR